MTIDHNGYDQILLRHLLLCAIFFNRVMEECGRRFSSSKQNNFNQIC
jgi:hypothetical protein